ncbi:MAG TPA: hypothetical protein VFX09_03005 [Burkholderiales bacterium]|nr:hypothetical protein [Burkholderiales bacterium]
METKSAANNLQQNAERNIERASQTAHGAVDRAAGLASSAAGRLGEKMGALGEKGDELLDMKDDWVAGAREYVREHPFAAVGIAVAAGYLFSMITRSK